MTDIGYSVIHSNCCGCHRLFKMDFKGNSRDLVRLKLVSLEPMESGDGKKCETWSPEFGQGSEELLRAGAVGGGQREAQRPRQN